MNLEDYKIKGIKYPNKEFIFGAPIPVIDEGSFYRIDGTHILDKSKIQDIEVVGNKIVIHMKKEIIQLEMA